MSGEGTPENPGEQGSEAPDQQVEGQEKPENTPDPDYVMDGHERNLEGVVDGANGEEDEKDEEEDDSEEDTDPDAKADQKLSDEDDEEEDEDEGEEEEEGEFWGPIMKAWEEEGFVAAALLALKLWTGWGEDEKKKAGEGPLYQLDLFESEDPDAKKLLETAKTQLDKVKEENPSWIQLAVKASEEYDLGPKGAGTILAMARFESGGFNPNAKAEKTSATGLGQFLDGTWEKFQKSLDEDSPYKGKPATDPEASIMAIAWYSADNMKTCKIKSTDPDLAGKLYEAHHEGAQGAKTMWTFREKGEPEGKVPEWAKKGNFKSFGVEKVEDYEDYSNLIKAMSGKVQTVADFYTQEVTEFMEDAEALPDNDEQ